MSEPNQLAPIGERTPEEILSLLGRKFRPDAIKQRKVGGGRQVAYIPVEAVIERLNKACNTWNFRVVARERETMILNRWNDATRKSEPKDVQVSVVTGELEIPELGTRQAIGVQALDDGSGEDLLKGAGSDALKKCASLFGVRVEGSDYNFQTAQQQTVDTDTGEIQEPEPASPTPIRQPQPAPAAPQARQDAPQATEPAPKASGDLTDYSTSQQWQAASRTLHAGAAIRAGDKDNHDLTHVLATKEGVPSLKNLDVKALLQMNNYIRSDQFQTDWERGLEAELFEYIQSKKEQA